MILILDTSHIEYFYLALAREGKIIKQEKQSAKFQQQEKLLLTLDKLLKESNIGLDDVKALVAVTGPGSFSALRIGLAVANTIAWQTNKKIVGFAKSEFSDYQDLLLKAEKKLSHTKGFQILSPAYDKEPNITIKRNKM